MNDDERLSKTKVWLGREGETLRAGPLAVGVAFLAPVSEVPVPHP